MGLEFAWWQGLEIRMCPLNSLADLMVTRHQTDLVCNVFVVSLVLDGSTELAETEHSGP
jgi:hypothetical protein